MKKNNWFIIIFLVFLCCFQMLLISKEKRIEVELAGNFLVVNPNDLNMFYNTEKEYLQFCFDNIYPGKGEDGQISELKNLINFISKIKIPLKKNLYVSIGFNYLKKNHMNQYSVNFQRDEGWRIINDIFDYNHFDIKIDGYIPNLGLHYSYPISEKIEIEGSVASGPVFANIEMNKVLTEETTSTSVSTGSVFPIYNIEKRLFMDGKGTGLYISGSLKLKWNFSKRIGLIFASGYSFQKINNVSGEGRETAGNFNQSWSGDWGIKNEKIITNWGSVEFNNPSNLWKDGEEKNSDFSLDMSGFYISWGFVFYL